jgi:hypothetical protein
MLWILWRKQPRLTFISVWPPWHKLSRDNLSLTVDLSLCGVLSVLSQKTMNEATIKRQSYHLKVGYCTSAPIARSCLLFRSGHRKHVNKNFSL